MKKYFFSICFLLFLITSSNATTYFNKDIKNYIELKSKTDFNISVNPTGNKINNCFFRNAINNGINIPINSYTFQLTCGTTITYFPPDGESLINIINAAISFNNALCGTNIPLISEIVEI
ncbi:MAG: hypothetical protein R2796_02250 [Chitinophagaceae bacterium]|nr:hypothetical protein [Chitinophagaceae bacterium]